MGAFMLINSSRRGSCDYRHGIHGHAGGKHRAVAALLRWVHLPLFIIYVAIVCFMRFYFNAGRLWLAFTVCGLRALALLLSFTTGQSLFFREITRLKHMAIFGGETISIPQGVLNPCYVVGPLSMLALVVYVMDASISLWRRGAIPAAAP